jgi:hypothetical protein
MRAAFDIFITNQEATVTNAAKSWGAATGVRCPIFRRFLGNFVLEKGQKN